MTVAPPLLQQAFDFKDESDAVYNLLCDLKEDDFEKVTKFKNWTFNNVLGHLHVWNYAADISLLDGEEWKKYANNAIQMLSNGSSINEFEQTILNGVKGLELLNLWKNYFTDMSQRFAATDPKKRVKWLGPDMSARSSISARLMETWSHSQALYDALGVIRKNEDRIKNIAILGNNTFKWCYTVHSKPIPDEVPYLKLQAPSGEIWEFNDSNNANRIEGLAEEFCQVVTQTRNIKDVNLTVIGETANEWMFIAQCFAGPPEQPPKPGARTIAA